MHITERTVKEGSTWVFQAAILHQKCSIRQN